MEVAGLVLALPPLIAGFWKVSQQINKFRQQIGYVPSLIASIEVQCSAIQNSLSYLKSSRFQHALQGNPQADRLQQLLGLLFTQCGELIPALEKHVEDFCANNRINALAKAKIVWNEAEIKELVTQLRGYQSDTVMLLMISQSSSIQAIRDGMDQVSIEDNHSALHTAVGETLSFKETTSADLDSISFSFISNTDKFSTTALYHSHIKSIPPALNFDFDKEILSTRLYRKTFKPNTSAAQYPQGKADDIPNTANAASQHGLNLRSKNSYEITMLGDGGAGKSALVARFIHDLYIDSDYDPTIEDTYSKHCLIDDQSVTLHIRDVTGQEAYSDLHEQYMREGDCYMLVYDVTSRSSFEEMRDLYQRLYYTRAGELVPLAIVGTREDAGERREVSTLEGEMFSQSVAGCLFFEVSAKTGNNVQFAFHELMKYARRLENWSDGT